jgi:hypothetical protein
MRKREDIDAALKTVADKARHLKERRVRLLDELVIATGADRLADAELAGALAEIADVKDPARREAWSRRGEAHFRGRARARPRSAKGGARTPANDDSPQPAAGEESAA